MDDQCCVRENRIHHGFAIGYSALNGECSQQLGSAFAAIAKLVDGVCGLLDGV